MHLMGDLELEGQLDLVLELMLEQILLHLDPNIHRQSNIVYSHYRHNSHHHPSHIPHCYFHHRNSYHQTILEKRKDLLVVVEVLE